jgi:hypothetical protein
MVARNDSPWYPEVMRLFRQPGPGQWQATIVEVSAALALFARDGEGTDAPIAPPLSGN